MDSEWYKTFTSRNWAFIHPDEQRRISQVRIGVAGCGMSSVVLELLTRLGFMWFKLVDGDVFELSNGNRQSCFQSDIGHNKAEITAQHIQAINPNVKLSVFPQYIQGEDSVTRFLDGVDIAINTIDLGGPFLGFNNQAARMGIPVIFPLNIGWGGRILVFKPDSPTLENLLGCSTSEVTQEALLHYIATHTQIPSYLLPILSLLPQRNDPTVWKSDPQLGPAVAINAGIIATIAVQLALNRPVKCVPEIITFDAMTVIS